jgi:hypothetical protein
MSDQQRPPRGPRSRKQRETGGRPGPAKRTRRPKPSPREERRRPKRRPTDKDVRTRAAKLDGFIDIHIRCGLEDSVVRIRQADYTQKITLGWMLHRQDILFRYQIERSEVIILLRGTDNARLRLSAPSPGNALPLAKVTLADEIRAQLLERMEKSKPE